jgi:hypothetical protein
VYTHPTTAQLFDDPVMRDGLAGHRRESYVGKTGKSMQAGSWGSWRWLKRIVVVKSRLHSKPLNERYRLITSLTEFGVQIRRFINTLYVSARVTYPKTQCNVDFGRAFCLIGIGDSDFSLSHSVTGRFSMQRIVAFWN